MKKVCYFCKDDSVTDDDGVSYRVYCDCCPIESDLLDVITYYRKDTNTLFAVGVTFMINEKEVIVEWYFENSGDDELRNNSAIYLSGDCIKIPGHPFTLENIKDKTKIYILLS